MLGVLVKVGLGIAATAVVGTAVVAVASPDDAASSEAVVTRHVDGDTFDVEYEGRDERVRLLNIDTPETKHPDRSAQCLGSEAAKFLAAAAPVESRLRLEFDKTQRDRYGRLLAAAFTSDGTLVNAEVARNGFARVVSFDDNIRFRPPVEAAWREAAVARRGLHSPVVPCTVPAQVDAMTESVAKAPTAESQPADASSAQLRRAADRAGAARLAAKRLLATLDRLRTEVSWTALTSTERARLGRLANAAWKSAVRDEKALRDAASVTAQEERARRIAREAAAAADRAEQERAAAARAVRDNEVAPAPPESSGGGDLSGYTGPRCYAPGGKTWRPC